MKDDLVAVVINFNTAALTARCVGSLLDAGVATILVLDNGSAEADRSQLDDAIAATGSGERVRLIASATNLGFAQGCNRLIEEALRMDRCARVLLLNSDATADPAGLATCIAQMEASACDLIGGRMLKPDGSVDALGITLYGSLLASNRKSAGDAYLGPTGGFAIYARGFLERVRELHGYVFDPSYFCYAEDTDLCVRARLIGAAVRYVDDVVAYHEGQQSTEGRYSEFILYHGIRNSIWMAAKSIPAWTLFTHAPYLLALHAGIVLRHTMRGEFATVVRLYRDAMLGLGAVVRARRRVQATRAISARDFGQFVDRKFYETEFLGGAIRDLFRRS
jgi:GT2 family glycosyltransferase